MGCTQTKKEILRSGSGKIYNRKINRQKKFRTGLHVEKTSEMGAEANFQAAYTTDTDEVYTKVNGESRNNNHHNNIPRVIDIFYFPSATLLSSLTTLLLTISITLGILL